MNLIKIKKNFYRDGFVHIRKLLNKDEIEEILQDVKAIKKKFKNSNYTHMHFTKDKKFNTIHNINKFVKKGKIFDLSKDKRLTRIIGKIIGKDIVLRNIEFFFKPKKTGKKAPIHQDNFFWNIPSKKAINVSKNGGVFYFLRSHKDGLIDHELSYHPGTSQQVSKKNFNKTKYKKILPKLSPGDCVMHHCEILHGSNENRSQKDRLGLVMSFKNKNAKVDKKKWLQYQYKLKKNLKLLNKSV